MVGRPQAGREGPGMQTSQSLGVGLVGAGLGAVGLGAVGLGAVGLAAEGPEAALQPVSSSAQLGRLSRG